MKEKRQKIQTGRETKRFHVWFNKTFTWMDSDVKAYCKRAWFASAKINRLEE